VSRTGWAVVIGAVAAVAVAAKKKRRRSGYRSPGVYVEEVPSSQLPIAGVGTSIAAFRKRLKRARDAYDQEVASGSKPIEAVGTAIAAFVGPAPGGPVNTP
jgi:phage tail sheath protein FI